MKNQKASVPGSHVLLRMSHREHHGHAAACPYLCLLAFCLLASIGAQADDGILDNSFGNGLGGAYSSVVVQSDGKVLVSGSLFVNGNNVNVARLNSDGTLDTTFGNGLSWGGGGVSVVAVQSDGKVLIGGQFTTVNGTVQGRIARLNSDGTLDTSFGNGLIGANSIVSAVTVLSDGKVLIGGSFTTVSGAMRKAIARLNSDGTPDTTFGNGLTAGIDIDGDVQTVSVQSDGKVLIGGVFSSINGTMHGRIARLNSDGTLDTTFSNGLAISPTIGLISTIKSVAVQSDGKMLIGGYFTTVNGTVRGNIARLNSDGTLDTTFGNGLTGADADVNAVALQSDGKVLIGGSFQSVNGRVRGGIARLNSDGTLDTTFGNGLAGARATLGMGGTIYSVALQSDGQALIGGYFTTVNGTVRGGIARLGTPPPAITVPGATLVFENAAYIFGTTNTVSVADLNSTTLTVTITVTNGVVGLSQTNGLTFTTGSGTNGTLVFSGTLENLNLALGNLYYLGNLDFLGTDTLVVVTDDGTIQTTNSVALTVVPSSPSITTAPMSTSFTLGQSVTLNVTATGNAPLAYQWQFNGTNIIGATSASLTLANLTITNGGSYSVVVSNGGGSITSTVADVYYFGDLNFYAGTTLSGAVGQQFRVDYADMVNIGTTNWLVLTNITLPYSPYLLIDPTSPGKTQRYYRAVPVTP